MLFLWVKLNFSITRYFALLNSIFCDNNHFLSYFLFFSRFSQLEMGKGRKPLVFIAQQKKIIIAGWVGHPIHTWILSLNPLKVLWFPLLFINLADLLLIIIYSTQLLIANTFNNEIFIDIIAKAHGNNFYIP